MVNSLWNEKLAKDESRLYSTSEKGEMRFMWIRVKSRLGSYLKFLPGSWAGVQFIWRANVEPNKTPDIQRAHDNNKHAWVRMEDTICVTNHTTGGIGTAFLQNSYSITFVRNTSYTITSKTIESVKTVDSQKFCANHALNLNATNQKSTLRDTISLHAIGHPICY